MMRDDWKLNHIGLFIRDWEIPMGYYQSTGMGVSIGPQIVTRDFAELNAGPPGSFFNREIPRVNGGSGPGKPKPPDERKPSTYTFMDKDCQVGDLLFEFILDPTIPIEGITHLCYNVPSPEEETKKLMDKGCDIVLSFTQGDKILENYVDTRKYGHVIISFRPPVARWEKAWTEHNQAHPSVSDWKFHGTGVAVRDLVKTIEYYEHLDVGVCGEEGSIDSNTVEAVKGAEDARDAGIKANARSVLVGPVSFDFVQPTEGETIFNESLDIRGEGICDIAFKVDDLESEIAKLSRAGVKVAFAGQPEEGPAFAYFDTRENSGNVMVRLIQG